MVPSSVHERMGFLFSMQDGSNRRKKVFQLKCSSAFMESKTQNGNTKLKSCINMLTKQQKKRTWSLKYLEQLRLDRSGEMKHEKWPTHSSVPFLRKTFANPSTARRNSRKSNKKENSLAGSKLTKHLSSITSFYPQMKYLHSVF